MNDKQKQFLIWAVVGILVLSFTGLGNKIFEKQTTQSLMALTPSVEPGAPCTENKDCGDCYESGGIGYYFCQGADKDADGNAITGSGACNLEFCLDRAPITTWIKDEPWAWVKNNPLIIFALLGILIAGLVMFGGKRR